jgi:hypothetical protein
VGISYLQAIPSLEVNQVYIPKNPKLLAHIFLELQAQPYHKPMDLFFLLQSPSYGESDAYVAFDVALMASLAFFDIA